MTRTLKKLLSAVLAVIMVLSMIPAVASARTVEVTDTLSYTENAAGWVEINDTSEFNDWFRDTTKDSILRAATKAGKTVTAKLILKADMTLNVSAYVGTDDYPGAHNITLDLNGYSITALNNGSRRAFAVYGGNLTIINSKDVGGITMKGLNSETGGIFYVNKGTLTMRNVKVTRTQETASVAYSGGILGINGATVTLENCILDATGSASVQSGGIVYMANKTTLNLYNTKLLGGSAINDETNTDVGGSVYAFSGTVNMYGGEISGGYAQYRGGNVYVAAGAFNMYGGVIANGETVVGTAAGPRGGNVYVAAGAFNMYGGEIQNGKSYIGNSIGIGATVNIYGGKISHSTATSDMGTTGIIYKASGSKLHVHNLTVALPKLKADSLSESYFGADCTTASAKDADGKITITSNEATPGEPVAATCTTAGYTPYTCSCGVVFYKDIVLPEHKFVDVEGVDATCTAAGHTKGKACSDCGAIAAGQLSIKKLGHKNVTDAAVAPDCVNTGLTEGKHCSRCGTVTTAQETVPALGHTEGAPVVENEVANSCTADGSYDTVVYCTVCEAEISRETTTVAAAGHTAGEPVVENEVANSCTADGSYDTVVYCTACEAEISRETTTVAATGHKEVTDAAVENSCTETGLTEGKHCEICGAVTQAQEVVPAKGHDYSTAVTAPTCENAGFTTYTCGTCGDTYKADETAALGHAYESVYTAPTFEADGFTTYVCANCGDTYVEADEGTKLTAVATADGVSYQTLQEALTAGGEVVLLQDVVAAEKLVASANATLDLNGCNLTLADVADNYALVVKGDLTIAGNGSIVAPGTYGIGVSATGKLTVNGGNFFGMDVNDYLIGNWGEVVINDGFFWGIYNVLNTFDGSNGTAVITGGQFMTDDTDYSGEYKSEVILGINTIVTGGQFTQLDSAYVAPNYAYITTGQVVKLADVIADDIVTLESDVVMTEKLTVSGTTILDLNGHTLTLANVEGNYGLVVTGTLKIVGEGEIIATGAYGIGVTGYLTIENGTFKGVAQNDYIVGNFGTTVINGGNFQGIYNCVNNFAGTTAIYGGTFTTAETDYTGEYEAADILADAGLTVYGGIFSKPVEAAYCAEGVYPKANEDGTYTVVGAAAFAADPASVTAKVGETVQFTAVATGDIIAYRWEYSRDGITWYNTKMEGVNTDTLTVPVLLSRDGYQYRCVVTDAYGNGATSQPATLTVEQPTNFAQITQQPAAQTAFAGESAIFAVEATGDGLTYQWEYSKNGTKWYYTSMTGYNTATLTVNATLARNGYQYRCVITDSYGTTVTSEAAALTVTEKEITTAGPQDQVATNGTAVFTVNVEGEGLTYRWQYQRADGTKWFDTTMAGYKTAELTVTATKARNGYKYRCIVTDAYGNETVSEVAVLTVE